MWLVSFYHFLSLIRGELDEESRDGKIAQGSADNFFAPSV
jgi:hypothetical protein